MLLASLVKKRSREATMHPLRILTYRKTVLYSDSINLAFRSSVRFRVHQKIQNRFCRRSDPGLPIASENSNSMHPPAAPEHSLTTRLV